MAKGFIASDDENQGTRRWTQTVPLASSSALIYVGKCLNQNRAQKSADGSVRRESHNMAASESALAAPIESKAQLVSYLEAGCKPPHAWRIGTEHEKFGFRLDDLKRPAYEGDRGVRALLEGLQRFGWAPINEAGNVIALSQQGASITLEPGGQFELSGAPLENLHQTCDEVHTHLDQVKTVAEELNIGFLGMGFDPKWRREDIPIMPKGRYGIMLNYMPTRGRLGLDMMLRSATVQVNMDFGSEADMVQKFRVSLALQSVATALFASSPFTEGRPNGFLSFRSQVWNDTDPDRTGILPFVFDDGMGFEAYVDYALDVPMYFIYRDGKYINMAGKSFRHYMNGDLAEADGEIATMQDWQDHLTTLFPEVRLKHFLEMRGADGGPWSRLCALPALWVGLLYDTGAQDAAWDIVKTMTLEEIADLRRQAPEQALNTPFRGAKLQQLAGEIVAIAESGLKSRARAGQTTSNETEYLEVLKEISASGRTLADELLEKYHGPWRQSVDPVYDELVY
jgi:glutamate--cysteine ligase